jgi:excisionase family DNA binding protein
MGNGWRDIDTHERDRKPVLLGLIEGGILRRVSLAAFNGFGYYEIGSGQACHWRTHWMPAPPVGPEGPKQREAVGIIRASKLAGVSRRTIYNWLLTGKLEYTRTAGGAVRIYVDTLQQGGDQRGWTKKKGRAW